MNTIGAAIARVASPSIMSTTTSTPSSSVRPSLEIPASTLPPSSALTTPTTASTAQRRNRAALRDYYNLKTRTDGATTGLGGRDTISPIGHHNPLTRRLSNVSTTSDSTVTTTTTTTNYNNTNDDTLPATPTTANRLSTSITTRTLPPAIDDTSFDAETYVRDLLKTSSLRDILRIEGQLVSEIKGLDGERKALVYDNYSKLIVAVGTLGVMSGGNGGSGGDGGGSMVGGTMEGKNGGQRKLADGVERLDGKLDGLIGLVKGMRGVGEESSGGDGDTVKEKSVRRQRNGEAREVRRKKEVVRWVLGSPDRLGALVRDRKREEAERNWSEIKVILTKWEGVKGVEQVREACEAVMATETQTEAVNGDKLEKKEDGPKDGDD